MRPLNQDNASVILLLAKKGCVQVVEVTDVEAVQHASLGCSPPKLVDVGTPNHPLFIGRANVDATCPQCLEKGLVHRVLVDVEADLTHKGRVEWRASSRSASASCCTRSASISSRLA